MENTKKLNRKRKKKSKNLKTQKNANQKSSILNLLLNDSDFALRKLLFTKNKCTFLEIRSPSHHEHTRATVAQFILLLNYYGTKIVCKSAEIRVVQGGETVYPPIDSNTSLSPHQLINLEYATGYIFKPLLTVFYR